MAIAELDNPLWSSLQARHRAPALRDGDVARYPAQFAPFVGVAHADVDAGDALARLLGPEEGLLLLGAAPCAAVTPGNVPSACANGLQRADRDDRWCGYHRVVRRDIGFWALRLAA
jgi:hypothetical protein